uniref:Uncharacterized protein n=1 Tax=Arundo donax TaxID=35708 RepID=A0A0A9HHJ0_ARUDO
MGNKWARMAAHVSAMLVTRFPALHIGIS